MSKLTFVSVLADRFSDFVRCQRLGVWNTDSQLQLLGYFDRYLHHEGFQGPWPTRDAIHRYNASIEHLHPGSISNRLGVVRQFCLYMRQFEPQCYVPSEFPLSEDAAGSHTFIQKARSAPSLQLRSAFSLQAPSVL